MPSAGPSAPVSAPNWSPPGDEPDEPSDIALTVFLDGMSASSLTEWEREVWWHARSRGPLEWAA